MKESNYVALTKCFFCLGDNGILLHKKLKNISECHGKVVDMTPCHKCEEYMKQGIIVITIDDTKSDPDWQNQSIPNPYRAGGWFVITDEGLKHRFNGPIVEHALKERWVFMEHATAEKAGIVEAAKNLIASN